MKLVGLLSEIITAGTITIYHRTKQKPSLFKNGYEPSAKGMYGIGLYGTYHFEDQRLDSMRMYGKYVIEYQIPNTKRFIVFDDSETIKIYGERYNFIEQLRKILGGDFIKVYTRHKDKIDHLNKIMLKGDAKHSIIYADYLVRSIPALMNYVDGLIYSGVRTGRSMILFNYGIAKPMRYTDDNENWNNIN